MPQQGVPGAARGMVVKAVYGSTYVTGGVVGLAASWCPPSSESEKDMMDYERLKKGVESTKAE